MFGRARTLFSYDDTPEQIHGDRYRSFRSGGWSNADNYAGQL